MSTLLRALLSIFLLSTVVATRAQNLPINVQGRVSTNGVTFNGVGKFKFALVLSSGRFVLWTHDGTTGGVNFQPTGSLDINVVKGLYTVMLGDTNIAGMKPIPADIFTNSDVRLRIWFNDDVHGFQQLQPDQRLGAAGYSFNSERADQAAVLTGNVTIQQVPSILITNNAADVTLSGSFTGNGSGLTGIRGSTPFQIADAQTNNAIPNTGYIVTNIAERVVLLPDNATLKVGDIVRVAGPGSWRIAQRADQSIFAGHFNGGVGATWTQRDASRSWTGIAMSTNGMNLAAVDYTRFIYRSTNGGVTWTAPQLSPSRKWLCIATSGDGQRFIAGTESDYLFISPDGENWSQRNLPDRRIWTGVASSLDGTNLVAVATGNGPLFTSSDAGDTFVWRQNAGLRNWSAVACSSDGMIIFGASDSGLQLSTSKGTNWSTILPGVVSSVACSADGLRVIAALANNIYTSTDRGTNWIRRDGAGSKVWRGITCSSDATIIGALGPDGVSVSVDAGGSWTVRASAADWRSIVCTPDGLKFAATVFNGFLYTSETTPVRFTTIGTAGYLSGGEASAVELQHTGNGRFYPLSSSGQIFAY